MVGRRPIVLLVVLLALAAGRGAFAQSPTAEVVSLDPEYGFLLGEDGVSRGDVRLRYRVRGRVQKGDEVWIELRDEATNAIYWKTSVPAKSSGDIVVPKGIKFGVSPKVLAFSVRNPTGTTTDVVKFQNGDSPYARDINVDQVSPSAVRVKQASPRLTLIGSGFTPESAAVIARFDKGRNRFRILGYAPVQFVNSREIEVTSEPSWFETPGELLIVVRPEMPAERPVETQTLWQSRSLGRLAVSPVTAPVLHDVEPASVPVGSDGGWVTLRGERFSPDCHVFISAALSPLTSNAVSATEIRALVPPGFLITGDDVDLRVECGGPGIVSAERPLRVVGGPVANRPTLEGALPNRMPPLLPTVADSMVVRLFGTLFEKGAIAVAHIDGETPAALPTEWISAHEVRATLSRERWGESRIAIVAGVSAR